MVGWPRPKILSIKETLVEFSTVIVFNGMVLGATAMASERENEAVYVIKINYAHIKCF